MTISSLASWFRAPRRFFWLAGFSVALAATTLAGPEGKAKIGKDQAQKVALERVPDGTIKSAELETEHGKLIWSFDIARPKTANITEIQVDAKTGAIVSQQVETPSEQAKESRAEKEGL